MKILVTGVAGFIGFSLTRELLRKGDSVLGVDNFNDYYSSKLKRDRVEELKKAKSRNFKIVEMDIVDRSKLEEVMKNFKPDVVCNLAGQAGIRNSMVDPVSYNQSNTVGFFSVLEACRKYKIPVVYASSSSVYGGLNKTPFVENMEVNNPNSFYAATKLANEIYAKSYWNSFNVASIGLRFFTVYGPWGRPDMAYFSFTKAIVESKPIKLFNAGEAWRDFTYVDDIAEGISSAINKVSTLAVGAKIFNLGGGNPVKLSEFVQIIEALLNKKAMIINEPLPITDLVRTEANNAKANKELGFKPKVSIEDGLAKFVDWYLWYYSQVKS